MTTGIKQALLGGIVGTLVMTVVMMVFPLIGMPEMSAPAMLSMMTGLSISVSWIMHFLIGVVFALAYAFILLKSLTKISNNLVKGAIFGMAAFIFPQIAMAVMDMIMPMPMPTPEGSMVLMMVGSIVGHVFFGITVAMFVKEQA